MISLKLVAFISCLTDHKVYKITNSLRSILLDSWKKWKAPMPWQWYLLRKQLIMNHQIKMILEGYVTLLEYLTGFQLFCCFFVIESLYVNVGLFIVSCLCSVITCNHLPPTSPILSLSFAWILIYICKMVLISYQVIIISQKKTNTIPVAY